ncbi:hypothetical protein KAFR_0C04820 [Kazachstania africana CBS 2517]|uniref:NTF2 domain-containing protein n=1 Tax=Kazachstania africana (strain ATCC 22294 / BCRC 22015 / CBS 2517 / CECT 1963 / NBRC 1671 / NRRL Y-8276) TaxID=1071382 RepID=H2ASX3_KAZAF|nr:hypothetical protein KAFR_0C04820 [Kazachstania africana CBS 2517]CCF57473.1 hypothetical protein KAFR_0C04820 [Kazachstania africana CBS 2517]
MSATVQEVVHAFLRTYYERMKTNPSKLSNMYASTAELTHVNYQQLPSDDSALDFFLNDTLPTVKLTGKDNINKFFTRNNKRVNDLKVKLNTVDFQTTGASHKSILLVTTGELFWTDTPVYRFCQTFILVPLLRNNDIYDISNDIIRFIPDYLQEIEIQEEKEPDFSEKEISVEVEEKLPPVNSENAIAHESEFEEEPTVPEKVTANETKKEQLETKVESAPEVTDSKKVEEISSKKEKPDDKVKEKKHSKLHQEKKPKSTEPSKSHSSEKHGTEESSKTIDKKENKEKLSKSASSNKLKEKSKAEDSKIVPEEQAKEDATEIKHKKNDEIRDDTDVAANEQVEVQKNENSENPNEEGLKEVKEPAKPAQFAKLSWASKLTVGEPQRDARKIVVTKPTTASNDTNKKEHQRKNSDKKFDMGSRKENTSNRNKKKTNNYSGVNKEGYFPIYVNNTIGLKEDELKNTLIKEFGPVMKVTNGDSFAVVDFQLQSSQSEAIERKKLIVNDVEISLERKTSKKSSSSQNGFSNTQKNYRKHNTIKKKDQVSV